MKNLYIKTTKKNFDFPIYVFSKNAVLTVYEISFFGFRELLVSILIILSCELFSYVYIGITSLCL